MKEVSFDSMQRVPEDGERVLLQGRRRTTSYLVKGSSSSCPGSPPWVVGRDWPDTAIQGAVDGEFQTGRDRSVLQSPKSDRNSANIELVRRVAG